MSSSVAKKYSYRSSVGRTTGNSTDVNIEYHADLTALTRLEVSGQPSLPYLAFPPSINVCAHDQLSVILT